MIPVSDGTQAMSVTLAILFGCVGLGFLSLRQMMRSEVGPGYWAGGIFANALGFAFWSGMVPLSLATYFLVGEILHIVGFFLLVIGAYRFTGNPFRAWNLAFLGVWTTVWLVAIALFSSQNVLAMLLLKTLRAVLFAASGTMLLVAGSRGKTLGFFVAGVGLLAWGVLILLSTVFVLNPYVYYGLLVGLQLVACLGMVAMVLDKMRIQAEQSEEQIRTLEGMLPICSYCKKIRDENDQWHRLEAYIENRSAAEFTHGICPDCFAKHKAP